MPSFGNVLVSPQIGLHTAEKDHLSPKADEQASACRYAVTLTRDNIRCEIVPGAHSVLYKFTFPASADAHIVVDAARKIGSAKALADGSVSVQPETGTISGGGVYEGNWAPGPYKLFFTAEVSKTPTSFGTWTGGKVDVGTAHAAIQHTEGGGFVGFSTHADEVVYLKIGLSFKSAEQSALWLHEEIPAWDIGKLTDQAKQAWNNELGTVSATDDDQDEINRFYTALFHTMVQPRDRTGDIWDTPEPFWDDHYTLWDSWRTVYPLLGLTDARAFGGVVNSFIARHRHYGYVPDAVTGGVEYSAGQGGNEVDNIITEAYFDQIPGVDWNAAHEVQLFNAEKMRTADYRAKGFTSIEEPKTAYAGRMKSGAATIEFAYNDFCVAELSKALGKTDEYKKYQDRAQNWTQVWNPAVKEKEYAGFPNSRHQDGTFTNTPPRAGYNTDFYEGTGWIYSYRPTYALPELIAKMGGKETFIRRLLYALKNKQIDFTNEPSFQTVWLFDAVDRPYLASRWADTLKRLYAGRAMPGDEDNGAMSSLYDFLDLGIFPLAGQDVFYLHGGRLARVSFQLHNGKQFTIISQNAGKENIYVQRARLNGKPLDTPMLRHALTFCKAARWNLPWVRSRARGVATVNSTRRRLPGKSNKSPDGLDGGQDFSDLGLVLFRALRGSPVGQYERGLADVHERDAHHRGTIRDPCRRRATRRRAIR